MKAPGNILVIDTASPVELVAASSAGRCSDRTEVVTASHSTDLFRNIDGALGGLGIGVSDLGLIGVGVGPGSFTGIRIAVTTARMMAQLLEIPLVGVKTHRFYAVSIPSEPGDNLLVAFDAKKGRVFGALYRRGDDPLRPTEVVEPGDYYIDFLLDRADAGSRALIAGSGSEKYFLSIRDRLPQADLLPGFRPSGDAACRLTALLYQAAPGLWKDLNQIVPLYSRKSDAETLKDFKKGI